MAAAAVTPQVLAVHPASMEPESESASRPRSPIDSSGIYQFIKPFQGSEKEDRMAKMSVGWQRREPPSPADQSYNADYCDGDYEFVPGSGSTTATPPPETLSGSTAQPSSNGSTLFSRRTHGQSSSVAETSNLPRHGPQPNFVQFLQHAFPTILPAEPLPQPQPMGPYNHHILWCEFRVLKDCDRTYRLDDTEEWIAHHCSHMEETFPDEVKCWFCDHVPFVADDPANRLANFHARMQHIRTHIFGEYKTANDMRTDYAMVKHMRQQDLVSESDERYLAAVAHSELPPPLRLPRSSSGPSRAIPRTMHLPLDEGCRTTLRHDLRKERRLQQRNGSDRL